MIKVDAASIATSSPRSAVRSSRFMNEASRRESRRYGGTEIGPRPKASPWSGSASCSVRSPSDLRPSGPPRFPLRASSATCGGHERAEAVVGRGVARERLDEDAATHDGDAVAELAQLAE